MTLDEMGQPIGRPLEEMGRDIFERYFPPTYDPDDITTWNATQLDELGVWAAAEQGYEVVDEAPDPVCPQHAVTRPGDHTLGVA